MPNLFKQFLRLIPDPSLQVGIITQVVGNSVTVELPDEGTLTVIGSGTVGQSVFIRGGVVVDDAPSLPVDIIEV